MTRHQLYDATKTLIASPPDSLEVNEKYVKSYYIVNVVGVIYTTNHRTDCLYLPEDDRRHFVAWSSLTKSDFEPEFWRDLWAWYESGGYGHVAAYLRSVNLDDFNPKAYPPQTDAFWHIVQANEAPEKSELRDAVEKLPNPDAFTIADIADAAQYTPLYEELTDRKQRRSIGHKFGRAGYVPVRNPDASDGMWPIGGRRQVIYARASLTPAEQMQCARARRDRRDEDDGDEEL